MRCYITGDVCDCGAYDVAGDCPHDEYVHEEEDLLDEETIEDIYYNSNRGHDDEIERF